MFKAVVIYAGADWIVIRPSGGDRDDQILDILDTNLIEHSFSQYPRGHLVQGAEAAYKAIYRISLDFDVEVL